MIIWLASFPRSGNTFMRVLLNACFGLRSYSQYNDVDDIGGQEELSKVVGHEMYTGTWSDFYANATKANERLLVKTHGAPIDAAKTIYLVRDPRSVVVSFHNYLQNYSSLELARTDTILGATAFGSWGSHIMSWRPDKRDDTLIVEFERLIKNPAEIADEVGAFLGLEKLDDSIPSFGDLKKINSKFFNSGSNKKNIATLTPEEVNLIGFLYRDAMKVMGYDPIERVNKARALDTIMKVSKNVWSLQQEVKRQFEANSIRLGNQKKQLESQHQEALQRLRSEQKEFVDKLIPSIQSSGVQAEALAKQSIALTEKFEKTNLQLQDLWRQKAELTAALQIQQNKVEKITEQAQNQFETVADERDTLKGENTKLSEDLSALEAASAEQLLNVAKLEARIATLDDLKLEYQTSLRNAEVLREAAVGKIQNLEDSLSTSALAFKRLKNENTKLSSKVNYRDRVAEELRQTIASIEATAEARQSEISNLTRHLTQAQDRVDKYQSRASEMSSQKIEQGKIIDSLERDLKSISERAQRLSTRNQELDNKYTVLKAQYEEVNQAVAPRLKSLLTLKPMRYVVNRRALVKSGDLQLDETGLPISPERDVATPPALQNPKSAERSNPGQRVKHGQKSSIYKSYQAKQPLGVAVFTFDRTESVENVLESLLLQDGLENTHVWIDGDQGNPKKRERLDATEQCVSSFPVKQVHRNRGNYGFRKMMIVSMRKMFEMYDRVLFLEDDCFPTRYALNGFGYELDQIEHDESVLSVYGHPFLTENEKHGPIGRFQGWGWASTRKKLMPLWPSLLDAYLMSEDEYKAYINAELTEEVLAHIDVTPGRQPSSTLGKFFAWDETLGFLAGKQNMTHKRTTERLIYNFGAGESSTHFNNIDHFKQPPFNMISIDEVWQHY